MHVTGKQDHSTLKARLIEKLFLAFPGPRFIVTSFLKIILATLVFTGLIACTETAPEFEDIGSSQYSKPTLDQNLILISDLTSNSPAIAGTCDDNTVSIGMKPEGQASYDEVATSSLDPSSDLNCMDGKFSLVISQAGTYMGFTLSLSAQKKLLIKTTGANGDFAEAEMMVRYLPIIPVIDVANISPSSNEGETATLRLTITPQATFGATFNYQTLDFTALAGSDYALTSGSVSFGSGDDYLDVPVLISSDSLFEADEVFKVSLDSASGAVFGASEASVTIPSNGTPPGIFIGNSTGQEGDTLTFTISLGAASGVATTFVINSYSGSAISGSDFTAISTSGSITAGSSTTTVDVVTTEDLSYESDETFQVSLSSVINATVGISGTDDVGTGTIQNDDTLVNIYLTAPTPASEGSNHVFTVSISGTSAFNVTYSFASFDGTATTSDSDYSALSAMGTLMAGDLSQTITLVSGNDATFELDETVLVSLSSVVGAVVGTVGADDVATATIQNNDPGPLLFVDDLTINEGTSSALSVSLSGVSGIDAVFTWQTLDGMASSGTSDYTAVASTQVTIVAGSVTSGFVYVDALADTLDEANEILTVTLAVVSGAGTGDLSADVTINDQNAPPDVYIFDTAAAENAPLNFVVSLSVISGQTATFSYQSYDGSASIADGDYGSFSGVATIPAFQGEVTLSLNPTDDSRYEPNETLLVSLSSVSNLNVVTAGVDDVATGTINNDDVAPLLLVSDSSVNEGDTLEFVVSLVSTSGVAVSFNYQSFDGNSGSVTLNARSSDSDFAALSGAANISAGELAVTLTSIATEDTMLEGNEQMILSLSAISGATIVGGGAEIIATGTINNDDAAPFIFVNDLTQTEGSSNSHVISLSEASGLPVEFSFTIFNQQVGGSDYSVLSGSSVTIAAGSTSSGVQIQAVDDLLDESNETYLLSLHSLVAAQASVVLATGTIQDNDATPSIFITDENINEPGTSTVTVSLSEVSGRDINFSYQSVANTATGGGTDYNDVALIVATISAGSMTYTFDVVALDDALNEGNEVFYVTLTSLVNVSSGDVSGTMTILDDDGAPNLSVYPVEINEGSAGIVLASLSATSGIDITFDWQTYNIANEAVAGLDYTPQTSIKYTIGAGDLTVGLTISATDDSPLDEADHEMLLVSLTNLANASFAVSVATVSISDIDTPPSVFVTDAPAVTEGASLQFAISLSKISGRDVVLTWSTVDGSASQAVGDYVQVASQEVTFSPGIGTIIAYVGTTDDSFDEATESVLVTISSAMAASIGGPAGSGDITDGDVTPTIAIYDVTVTENSSATLKISLSAASGQQVDFVWTTQDGTASVAAGDYSGGTGSLTIAPYDTHIFLTIPVLQEGLYEGEEQFYVTLSSLNNVAVGDDLATVVISNTSGQPGLFVTDAASVTEGALAYFVVSLDAVSGGDVRFNWQTYDDTAVSAYDFTMVSGTEVTVPAGQLQVTLSVNTTDDDRDDSSDTEYFGVTLTSAVGASLSVAGGSVALLDNDLAPNIFVADLGGSEGQIINVQLSLSAESERNVMFDYKTFDGTATVAVDYSGRDVSGAQFASYTLAQSLAVTLLSDDIYEFPHETFLISLTPGVDAGSGGDHEATLTVTSTNALPQIMASDATPVTEGGAVSFIVSLTGLVASDVSFNWNTLEGWATDEGSLQKDFDSASGTSVIPGMQPQITISINTTDDLLGEPQEDFFITLTSASANATITGSSGQALINDNDGGVFLKVYGDTQVEGSDLVFTVSKSSNLPLDVTFDVDTFDATASLSDSDYTSLSGQKVTIGGGLLSGDMFATVTVPTTTDTTFEDDETVVLSISNVTNASVATAGTDDVATGTINNNDSTPSIFISDLSFAEDTTAYFLVSLGMVSGVNAVFTWQTYDDAPMDAAEGTDYTGTSGQGTVEAGVVATSIPVVALPADVLDEANEQFLISLAVVSDAGTGNLEAVGTIIDNDGTPNLYVSDTNLTEGSSAWLTVSLEAVTGYNINFDFATTSDGTATSGVDFASGSGTLTILSGDLTIGVLVDASGAHDDSVFEVAETFGVTISNVSSGAVGRSLGVVTISDNDSVPNLKVYDTQVSEGGAASALVSLSEISGAEVVFDLVYFDGSASLADGDYSITSGPITIINGIDSASVTIGTGVDTKYEPDEIFLLSLTSLINVTVITPGVDDLGTVTISDNDLPPQLFIDAVTVPEGQTALFSVSISEVSGYNVSFAFNTVDIGDANSGTDYQDNGALTFAIPAGSLSMAFGSVTVFHFEDSLFEGGSGTFETYQVSLMPLLGTATVLGPGTTVGIQDIDTPASLFIANGGTHTEGQTVGFVVSLAAAFGNDVTFDWTLIDGAASVSAGDFEGATSGTATITAGDLAITLAVITHQDQELEADEGFAVSLSNPSANANVMDNFGVGTISNDDSLSIEFVSSSQSVEEGLGDQPEKRKIISAGMFHSCGIGRDKRAYCWGRDEFGELGNGGVTVNQLEPQPVAIGASSGLFREIDTGWGHTCALGEDQKVYCWGRGQYGRLGDNSSTDRDAPVQVGLGDAPGTFKSVASGEIHNCALGTDQKVYCWGRNWTGMVGDGTDSNSKLVPTAVSVGAGLTGAHQISAGQTHSCAIGLDSHVYCWGDNSEGALGDSSNTNSNVPVLMDDLGLPVSSFVQVESGRHHNCALGTDDKAYCWGRNIDGQLGNGGTTGTSIPVATNNGAGPGTYKMLATGYSHMCAIGTDDRVYCWGENTKGQLGSGTTGGTSTSPVLAVNGGGPGTYKYVDAGYEHTCALGTDDEMYCWGEGNFGQLGRNSSTDSNSPVGVNSGENNGSLWAEPLVELEVVLKLGGYYFQEITVPFTVGGTASNPTDHTATSGVMTIAPYKSSFAYNLDLVNDGVVESSETISFDLSSPSTGGLGATTVHTATILDEDVGPTIVGVSIPVNMVYGSGVALNFAVTFSKAVTRTGSVRIPLDVGGSTKYASYSSGSGTETLYFSYTPGGSDLDMNGIEFVSVSTLIDLNGGTVNDSFSNAANLDASGLSLPSLAGVLVDAVPPTLTINHVTSDPTNNPLVTYSFAFSEDIDPASFTTSDIVAAGSANPTLAGAGIITVTPDSLYHVILAPQNDGLAIANLSFGSISDVAGNTHNATNNANNQVNYDGSPPSITSVTPPSDGIYTSGPLNFTVDFTESVNVNGSNSSLRVSLEGAIYNATYQGGDGTSTFSYQLIIPANVEVYGGVSLVAPVQDAGDIFDDVAGNTADLSFTSPDMSGVTIDSRAPTITGWGVPADGVYSTGTDLNFTVTFSESVTVPVAKNIGFDMNSGSDQADYFSGSGTSIIVFRYTVQTGDSDPDGITIPTFEISGTGSIGDLVGNGLASSALSVKDTSGIQVGAPPALFLDGSGAAGGSRLDGVAITTCGGGDVCDVADPFVLTMAGVFSSVSLVNGAALVAESYSGGAAAAGNGILEMNITEDLFVDATSVISMSGRGYRPNEGPGASSGINTESGGAGHAGAGGPSEFGQSGGVGYGSITMPVTMGSGSKPVNSSTVGAVGGGAISITVGGLAHILGTIQANGQDGVGNASYAAGGGAGGSIYLETDTLKGIGYISAQGGDGYLGTSSDSGGGSGGRIAIYYQTLDASELDTTLPLNGGSLNLQAFGGDLAGNAALRGATGTIFYDDTNDAFSGFLLLDNNTFSTKAPTPITSNLDVNFFDVFDGAYLEVASGVTLAAQSYGIDTSSYLKHSGHLAVPSAPTIAFDFNWTWDGGTIQGVIPGGYLTIPDGYTMTFTDHTLTVVGFELEYGFGELTSLDNDGSTFYRVDIEATDIYVGGVIDVSLKGNPGGMGFLPGTPSSLAGGSDTGAAGGSHGGHGGRGTHGVPDTTNYGDILGGMTLGAGGGSAGSAKGGDGGGYVRLRATNLVDLDDAYIYANGGLGQVSTVGAMDLVGGSGSGGAVEVVADTIYMSASAEVDLKGGGAQQLAGIWGGAGGGGRAYFEYDTYGDDTEILNNTKIGIQSSGDEKTRGAPGLIVLKDNNNTYTGIFLDSEFNRTVAETPLYTQTVTTLTLSEMGVYEGPNVVVPLGLNLNLSPTDMTFSDTSYNPSIIIEGEWQNTVTDIGYSLVLRNPSATAVNAGTPFTISTSGLLEIGHNQLVDWSGVDLNVDGKMTHSENLSNTVDNQIYMKLNSLTLDALGMISVTGKGFGPGMGPGAGQNAFTNSSYGGGGGHGGRGGDSLSGMWGGFENDNAFAPTLAGSGGGGRFDGNSTPSPENFGYGGGVVRLDIQNNLTLNGAIEANGVTSPSASSGYGAGAGGAVSISVGGTFSGTSGYVKANGGGCGTCSSGGGGGGRIWLPMENSGSVFVYANGGTTNLNFNGQPGSIYRGPAQLNIQTPFTTMLEPSFYNGLAVSLTHSVPYDVTLSVHKTLGTAEDEDFYLYTNTIIIAEGQTSGMILLDILDDAIWEGAGYEDDFVVSYSWSAPSYVISGGLTTATNITITDNESAVKVYAPTSFLLDEGTTNHPVVLSLSHASEAPVNIGYGFSNYSISPGIDYSVTPGPGVSAIVIPATQMSYQLSVNIIDTVNIGQQYFSMDYTDPATATPITIVNGSTTIHINDNDAGGSGQVYLLDAVAVEGDQLIFTVTWTGSLTGGGSPVLSLNLFAGTAIAGDYSNSTSPPSYSLGAGDKSGPGFRNFAVQLMTDALSENNEYFTAQLNCSGGGGPCGEFNSPDKGTATGTILDQPTIQFKQIWINPVEGQTSLFATVETSSGNPLSRSVSFDIHNYSETAQLGADYVLPTSMSFELPIGISSIAVPIQLINNDLFEFDETFTLSLTNISGGAFGGLTVLTITIANDDSLEVEPQFPINGRNWMDYVKRDISASEKWFEASDTACDPDVDNGAGGYSNCIHGGEAKVMRTGIDSCSGLKVTDAKKAFTWHCDETASGYADFYSYQLNDDIGLADLVEGGGTPYLSTLSVSIAGSRPEDYGIASLGARWSNPVIAITQKSSPNQHCRDFDVESAIYYTHTSMECMGAIKKDKVAVVTSKAGLLKYPSSAPKLCEGGSPLEWCMLSSNSNDFLWIEVNIDSGRNRAGVLNVSNRSEAGIILEDSQFSMVRRTSSAGALANNLRLTDVGNSKISHSRFSDQVAQNTLNNGNVFIGSSEYLLFESLNINNSRESGISLRNTSTNNLFNKIVISGSTEVAMDLKGVGIQKNTLKDISVLNTGHWGVSLAGGDDNSLVNGVFVNTGDVGVGLVGSANDNQFANLSIYRTDGGVAMDEKIRIDGSDSNLFYGQINFDSGTGSCAVVGGATGNEIDASCDAANGGSSSKNSGLDLSGSFIGKVTVDSPNPEVAASFNTIQYDQIDLPGAWSSFENFMRAWGHDNPYTVIAPQGRCGEGSSSEYCQLNDWNLSDSETELKFGTTKVSEGVSCPTEFNGSSGDASRIFTDAMTSANTFFVEAEEISGDGVGDDDTLCESNERCVQIFNFGADQDVETRQMGGSCTFSNGTISGVELLSLVEYDVFDTVSLGSNITLSEGNLRASFSSPTGATNARATTGKTSGKYYFEYEIVSSNSAIYLGLGNTSMGSALSVGTETNSISIRLTGEVYNENDTSSPNPSALSATDIVGIAVDIDQSKVWISVNSLWYNGADWTTSDDYVPLYSLDYSGGVEMVPMISAGAFANGSIRLRSSPTQIEMSNVPAGFTPGWPID